MMEARSDSWRRRVAELLQDAGLDQHARETWLSAEPKADPSAQGHARDVLRWQAQFGDATLARTWYDSPLCMEDAVAWHRAGYTPDEGFAIGQAILRLFLDTDLPAALMPEDGSVEDDWRSSGLPAHWILTCLSLGIIDAGAAQQLFEARQS